MVLWAHEFLEKYNQRKIALKFNYKIENQVRIGLNPWPFRVLARVEVFWDLAWVGSGHDSLAWELLLFFL
jgi:hypothetical protein